MTINTVVSVPDEIVKDAVEAVDFTSDPDTEETVRAALTVAAPLIVAAELERIAAYYMPDSTVRPEDCLVTEEALEAAESEGTRSMCGCLMFVASQIRSAVPS